MEKWRSPNLNSGHGSCNLPAAFLPMYVLTRLEIPPLVIAWLRYVPWLFSSPCCAWYSDGKWAKPFHRLITTLASLSAFLVAWRYKNMMLTVTLVWLPY